MAHPYGWGVDKDDQTKPDLTEPLKLAGFLQSTGAPFVNITIGNPYYNPYVNRPFDLPTARSFFEGRAKMKNEGSYSLMTEVVGFLTPGW